MNTELQLEILKRVQDEIAEAQAEGHVIVDDWFPFDADLEINIWTENGVTHAWVYPKDGDDIGTEIFSERLTWRSEMKTYELTVEERQRICEALDYDAWSLESCCSTDKDGVQVWDEERQEERFNQLQALIKKLQPEVEQ